MFEIYRNSVFETNVTPAPKSWIELRCSVEQLIDITTDGNKKRINIFIPTARPRYGHLIYSAA